MKARLILEDGKSFEGTAFGAEGKAFGEVVSHTAMIGYQQLLTEPANAGLIVCMTYPLVGNYGVNREDVESSRSYLNGLIVREFCGSPSNFRCENDISNYLVEHGIVGICNIDTRTLSRYLREREPMQGAIVSNGESVESVVDYLKNHDRSDYLQSVAAEEEPLYKTGENPDIVLIDLGVRLSFLRSLREEGLKTVLLSAGAVHKIDEFKPRAAIIAGGPGDPAGLPPALIKNIRNLIGKFPLLGISLGMQALALAMGAVTTRLKTGHRGDNYPVKDNVNGRVYITSQNRGFTVVPESLPPDVIVTHCNVHDGSVEGFRHSSDPVWGIEFWPYYSKTERVFSPVLPEPFINVLQGRK